MDRPVSITERDYELLAAVVQRWSPELDSLLPLLGRQRLSVTQREQLRGVLAKELIREGLDQDDEPTAYGLELDDLIGRLMFF